MTHCGICHTGVGMVDNEWGVTKYPFVPGHEIAGTVGASVDPARLRVGQRVAVGAVCGSPGVVIRCVALGERDS
ncbi:alcohol dehydrogenase catalytic domain-containing protein [Sorangium sp. So ce429]